MHTTTPDPLVQAARLAADYGIRLDPDALADSTAKAGTLDRPERLEIDLAPQAVAVCDLLLRECWTSLPLGDEPQPVHLQAAMRLRMLARIASLLLPPVVYDYAGQYDLVSDEEGCLPDQFDIWAWVRHHAARVEDYLRCHDAGDWVDPYAVAGAVADLHDSVRMIEGLIASL